MDAPATFWRRYAAYSVDVAAVVVIAVPLLAWQMAGVPAAFDAAVEALQLRLWDLLDGALMDPAGPLELARRWADDPGLRAGIAALADVVLDAVVVAMLVLVIFLAFGISFELPVAVVVLVLTGLVTPAQLREFRGYVIVGVFIVAAVITPPDVVSQLLLAIPMCLLYEIGIVAGALLRRRATA